MDLVDRHPYYFRGVPKKHFLLLKRAHPTDVIGLLE